MGHSLWASLLSQVVSEGGQGAPSHLSIYLPYAVEAAKDMQLFFLVASTTAGNEGLGMFGALMLFGALR